MPLVLQQAGALRSQAMQHATRLSHPLDLMQAQCHLPGQWSGCRMARSRISRRQALQWVHCRVTKRLLACKCIHSRSHRRRNTKGRQRRIYTYINPGRRRPSLSLVLNRLPSCSKHLYPPKCSRSRINCLHTCTSRCPASIRCSRRKHTSLLVSSMLIRNNHPRLARLCRVSLSRPSTLHHFSLQ